MHKEFFDSNKVKNQNKKKATRICTLQIRVAFDINSYIKFQKKLQEKKIIFVIILTGSKFKFFYKLKKMLSEIFRLPPANQKVGLINYFRVLIQQKTQHHGVFHTKFSAYFRHFTLYGRFTCNENFRKVFVVCLTVQKFFNKFTLPA